MRIKLSVPNGQLVAEPESNASAEILMPFIEKFSNFQASSVYSTKDLSIMNCTAFMKKLYNCDITATVKFTHYVGVNTVYQGYADVSFVLDGYLHQFVYGVRYAPSSANENSFRVHNRLYDAIFQYYKVTKDGERCAPDGYPCAITLSTGFFIDIILHYNHKNKSLPSTIMVSYCDFFQRVSDITWSTRDQYHKDKVDKSQALYESGYFDDNIDDALREFIWEMV